MSRLTCAPTVTIIPTITILITPFLVSPAILIDLFLVTLHGRAESFDPPDRTEDRALLRSSGGARSAVYPSQASGVINRPFQKHNF